MRSTDVTNKFHLSGSGNGGTTSLRVDNGGSTPITYTLSHEPALAQLYSTDVTAQVRAHLKMHNVSSSFPPPFMPKLVAVIGLQAGTGSIVLCAARHDTLTHGCQDLACLFEWICCIKHHI